MKNLILLTVISFLFNPNFTKAQGGNRKSLACAEYWAKVPFKDFCGLSAANFKFNSIPVDICNADQNSSYPFDDLVSIRVYNHFSNAGAKEEYDDEEEGYASADGYRAIADLGDDAFGILRSQFGKLDQATIILVKGTFTISLDINGKAANGANNCFTESSAIQFAKALVAAL